MKLFKKNLDGKLALHWLLGATGLLYVLACFLPCAPQKHFGVIDDSWMQVLHTAWQQHWQFGRDIVFTFGPWGFLYGGFEPATQFVSVIVWTALALVFWWVCWRIARHFFTYELGAWLWFLSFVAVSSVTIFLNMDVRLTSFAVLLLLLHFFVEDKPWSIMQAVLTIALGLLSLVKFGELLLAVVIVLAMAGNSILRYRRFPWILPVFGGGVLLFWILAGQHLDSLPAFLVSSWQVTNGYTEAMMLTRANEWRDVYLFVATAILLCVLVGVAAWPRHRFLASIPVAVVSYICFAAFKYGYVRHDGHELTAVSQLLLVSLVCAAPFWAMAWKKGLWAIGANFLPLLAVWFLTANTFSRYSNTGLAAAFAGTLSIRELFAPLELLRADTSLLEAHEKFLGDYRSDFPLPAVKGSVDIYPLNQAAVLAHGLDYRPRPIVQSYSAYTEKLATLDAAFLRSERAPENIFFQVATIDERFPSLDDGLSWPELFTKYAAVGHTRSFVQLQRRTKPSRYQMIPLSESSLALGTTLNLPSSETGPIWAEIEIKPTLKGKLASFFFKPPILWMTTTLTDGRTHPFRIVPGMALGGFLISPVVFNTDLFELLATTNSTAQVAEFAVASISLFTDTKSGAGYYQSPVRVRLYRLSISAE